MHMADALVSPVVGGTMLVVSGGVIGYCVREIHKKFDNSTIPLMGVMGAFIFATQMINFAIPGTGSSGHIGGAMLLAILLGPAPAFLVLSAVLAIQALLFADGGLLALGCNIFNLGFWGCFVAYPLIYKPLALRIKGNKGVVIGAVLSTIIALQLGAFSVVLESLLSNITELPFMNFLLLMQPIHLAIGGVEGVLTALTLLFLYQARPQLCNSSSEYKKFTLKSLAMVIFGVAILCGGVFSLFASGDPDGLEWAIERSATQELAESPSAIQQTTALMPDYSLAQHPDNTFANAMVGVIGTLCTLLVVAVIGVALRKKSSESIS